MPNARKRAYLLEYMRNRRQNEYLRERERLTNSQNRRQARQNESTRNREQSENTARRRAIRENLVVRQEEQVQDTERRRSTRLNSVIRQQEQAENSARRRTVRKNPVQRQEEQTQDTTRRRTVRENPVARQEEQTQNTARRRTVRENPVVRQEEQTQDTARRRTVRENPVSRQEEQAQNTVRRRTVRENAVARQEEQTQDTARRRTVRENPVSRQEEQAQNTVRRRTVRENAVARQEEQTQNTVRRRIVRENTAARRTEQTHNTSRRREARASENVSWQVLVNEFKKNVANGPTINCYSCDRLFFTINTRSKSHLMETLSAEFINSVILDEFIGEASYQLCDTCLRSIKKNKAPRLNIKQSNLAFPALPDSIRQLTPLEVRLVSPRIPFMKIYGLYSKNMQMSIKAGIINVMVDIEKMFKTIPIQPQNAGVVQLKLKRRSADKNHYIFETISTEAVYEAAQYLITQPLFKELGITINEQWTANPPNVFDVDQENDGADAEVDLEPAEEEAISHVIEQETLMDANKIVEFAPGEGNRPSSILMDQNAEELAFPQIFGGHRRNPDVTVNLSFAEITVSELERRDRRAVIPEHLLYVHKKCQLFQIRNNVSTALRKSSEGNGRITVNDIVNGDAITNLVNNNDGYHFLKQITGSPVYFANQKKNVMAMIRTYGIPTFFITLSAAETRWEELLKILKKTIDNVDNADVSNLSFEEKCRLIKLDPVTCARYFNHRFRELMKTWYKTTEGPFGNYEVQDYYYRIEFQHRGSPHVHMVVWLKNAPQYNPDDESNITEVEQFVDSIVSCDSNHPDVPANLIEYQGHTCRDTCKPKRNRPCRFNYPICPMDRTRILKPYKPETDSEKEELKTIRDNLQSIDTNLPTYINTFDEFLTHFNCSLEKYILAVRSSLDQVRIFYKRGPKDIRRNLFSPKIINLMQSNMDIQFVLTPYACANYMVDYMNKDDRGISRLLRECQENIKNQNNITLREKLKQYGNTFYNGTEISAQEAAWCRLKLPMTKSSTKVVYIHTSPSSERTRILKSARVLQSMKGTSEDIYQTGDLDRYAKRSNRMEKVCLADFVAEYNYIATVRGTRQIVVNDEDRESNDDSDDNVDQNSQHIYLKDESGYMKKRTKPKIIRYRRYNLHQDPENYYREIVMLYHPWRNEQTEVGEQNCEIIYQANKERIDQIRQKYHKGRIDEVENLMENLNRDDIDLDYGADHDDGEPQINPYDYDENEMQPNIMVDLGHDIPEVPVDMSKKFCIPEIMNQRELDKTLSTLNEKQHHVLIDILNRFKIGEHVQHPFYSFISGAAGVGKSRLITALYQCITRYFRLERGAELDLPYVILAAPTGKAAHNIHGMTAHSIFSLPVNQKARAVELSADLANTLYSKLRNMKLLIIDEISMLGAYQFENIDLRMKQIFKSDQDFGGISVLAFGDFNQLRPVQDCSVFQVSSRRRNNMHDILDVNPLWEKFNFFELTQIMRQKDDATFAEALRRYASATLQPEDRTMFESRCFATDSDLPEEGKSAIHLFSTNKEVAEYNRARMTYLKAITPQTVIAESEAIDNPIGSFETEEKNRILQRFAAKPLRDTYGMEQILKLQTGVKYMITNNIDVSDGLFNGACGTLRSIQRVNNIFQVVWMEFETSDVGSHARLKYRSRPQNILDNWTPIRRLKQSIQLTKGSPIHVCREQFPLTVAEGLTVHKSQGSSLQNVVVNLGTGWIGSGAPYVAYSRATTLAGLYIIGKLREPKKRSPTDAVHKEMESLNNNSYIPRFMHLSDEKYENVISFNVQSLKAHKEVMQNDPVFRNATILLLQETWLGEKNCDDGNDTALTGFAEIVRNIPSRNQTTRGFGTICYVKNKFFHYISAARQRNSVSASGNGHIEATSFKWGSISFINVYRSPGTTLRELETFLNNIFIESHFTGQVLVAGDFNLDLSKDMRIIDFMRDHNLQLISPIQPTTNNETCLDAMYGSFLFKTEGKLSIYESLFSYHKPLVLQIEKEVKK